MVTIAQAQSAVATLESQIDALVNTAIDGANPNGPRNKQIVALLQATKASVHNILTDALAQAQALGVQ